MCPNLVPCCGSHAMIVLLCHAVLCCAFLRYAMLCCALLCCDMLCCALPLQKPTLAHAATSAPQSGSASGKPYSYLPDGNYLTTVNDKIVDQSGNVVSLHGIAWYGFGDASTAMVEGLSNGYDSQTQDFATVVVRMKALGFNTIKLPFSFATLAAGSTRPFPSSCSLASSATIMNNLQEKSKPPVH